MITAINAVVDYGATGNGSTDDTNALQNAIGAASAANRALFIPAGTYKITAPLDMRANGLRVFGQSREQTIIRQHTANTPVLRVGHRFQHISDLQLTYVTMPTSAHTSSNAVELYKAYWSAYERIFCHWVGRGVYIPQVAYTGLDSTATNGLFSCLFNDIRITGYAINALSLRSFQGGGTGNVWNNTYISNNPAGTRLAPSGYVVEIAITDETVFNQLNLEWVLCQNADLMLIEAGGPVVFNALHIEQVSLELWNAALALLSDGGTAIINGVTMSHNQVVNAGTHAFARGYLDNHLDIRGLYHHDNTVAGTFVVYNAASATAGAASARVSAARDGLFTGLVANEKPAPLQVMREYNGNVFIRQQGGRNVTTGSAAPAAGTWAVGDTVYNTAPVAGGTIGWVCTAAGTPGTWKSFGAIAA